MINWILLEGSANVKPLCLIQPCQNRMFAENSPVPCTIVRCSVAVNDQRRSYRGCRDWCDADPTDEAGAGALVLMQMMISMRTVES